MAMNKEDMTSAIIEACQNENTPQGAMIKFSDTVKTYIEDNCEITYSWNGIFIPPLPAPPVVDTITSFKASISFTQFQLVNPIGADATTARMHLGTQLTSILSSILLTTITPVDPTFVIAYNPLLPVPMSLPPDANLNTPILAMEHFCDQIITGIKAMINVTPAMGSHITFTAPTGIGAIMTSIE